MSFLKSDGKALVVAMDHARTHGTIEGLENPGVVIDAAVDAGADAVMTTFGVVKHYQDRLIGRIPTILRLDGGPSLYREDWLAYTEWDLLHSVEDALLLGADAVVLMLFIGIPVELKTYRIVAKVASECMHANLPLMVEALPCPSERIPDPKAAEAMASAARLAFEHGADLVKAYYTGNPEEFRQVTDNCPIPVLIAGGPKMDTTEETFQVVHGAMQGGAAGVVFGRNIWQSGNTRGMIRALQRIIHDDGSVGDALNALA
ncbi:MAG: 3-hydroxy-5-phosphonooxypentane-2,4-dione thiolase [Anaerolineales bacterium]|nr:3-hydroxy-5-phosphonooxypentane-2,4-dione thiolase [Anaerolineales bacterium]